MKLKITLERALLGGMIIGLLTIGIMVVQLSTSLNAITGFATAQMDEDVKINNLIAFMDPIELDSDSSDIIYFFGACMDSSSQPVASNATLAVFNGTGSKLVNNVAMTELETGHFSYTYNNTVVNNMRGNYFSRINCSDASDWVVAYDNFQIREPSISNLSTISAQSALSGTVKSVQRGTIAPGATTSSSYTDTVTAVDTSKSFLIYLGDSGNVDSVRQRHYIQLTDSTTVTATRTETNTITPVISYVLVEFN